MAFITGLLPKVGGQGVGCGEMPSAVQKSTLPGTLQHLLPSDCVAGVWAETLGPFCIQGLQGQAREEPK